MSTPINGRAIAAEQLQAVKLSLGSQTPKRVCFVLFGDDAASMSFIKTKQAVATRIGVAATLVHEHPVDMDQAEAIIRNVISQNYDGIVLQLPVPQHLDMHALLDMIPAAQDIDLLRSDAAISGDRLPPVTRAILWALSDTGADLATCRIVILGNGDLVGKPLALWLTANTYKYTTIDIDTPQKEKEVAVKNADIIVSGIGVPHFLQAEMVRDSVILIDAGTSEQSGKLVGDIDPTCYEKASYYTPVPGGIGPMTVAALFANLLHQ